MWTCAPLTLLAFKRPHGPACASAPPTDDGRAKLAFCMQDLYSLKVWWAYLAE